MTINGAGMFVVSTAVGGSAANVGVYSPRVGAVGNCGAIGGWSFSSLAFDGEGSMWCVGTAGNLGKWDNETGWVDQHLVGGWQVQAIAFDATGTMWSVQTATNHLGKFDSTTGTWSDQGLLGNWPLQTIAFDSNGNLWGVNEQINSLGQWNPATSTWVTMVPQGVLWVAFDASGGMWVVNTDNRVSRSIGGSIVSQGALGGWQIQSLTWGVINPAMVDLASAYSELQSFFQTALTTPAALTQFLLAPVDTFIANGINLDYLSDGQLEQFNAYVRNTGYTVENGQLLLDGTAILNTCNACIIAVDLTFTVWNLGLTLATGGVPAILARTAAIAALAQWTTLSASTIGTAIGFLVNGFTIKQLATSICGLMGLCGGDSEMSLG